MIVVAREIGKVIAVAELARFKSEVYPRLLPLLLPETNDSHRGHSRCVFFLGVALCAIALCVRVLPPPHQPKTTTTKHKKKV